MAGVEQLRRREGVNLVQLEADIAAVHPGGSLPDYVEHTDGVTRAGALSAEAVVRDYESAAKEMEAMGSELIDAARKCEALTAQVHDAIAFMRETAAGYREEGRKIFERIEFCEQHGVATLLSTNGTFLNRESEPIGAGDIRNLRDGDRLRLGAYEIEVRLVEEAIARAGAGGTSPFADPFAMDPFAPAEDVIVF